MALEEALRKLGALLTRREPRHRPMLVMLAGSNGAGKSTFYEAYLAALPLPFINADRIASDLRGGQRASPPHLTRRTVDEAAQRMADEQRQACILLGRSFVTETVLSDPRGAKVAMLKDARARAFEVCLFFIGISSPSLSAARVRERVVSRGGHDVPSNRIVSRFPRTLTNLPSAVSAASIALLLDNDLVESPYRFVAQFDEGKLARRSNLAPTWAKALLP